MAPPAKGPRGLQIYKSLLHKGPVVQPGGVIPSVQCRKLEFGPSKHCGASYTMATWLLSGQKQAQVAELGEGGGEGGDA